MRHKSKSNQNHQYYLLRNISEMLGPQAEYIPSPYAVVMFPEHASAKRVLLGLDLIRAELEAEMEVSSWETEPVELEVPWVPEEEEPESIFDEIRRKLGR